MKAKSLPFSEDPTIVAFQYAHKTAKGTIIMEPLRLGKRGAELGLNASTINAGLADKSIIGFGLPNGGAVYVEAEARQQSKRTESPVA